MQRYLRRRGSVLIASCSRGLYQLNSVNGPLVVYGFLGTRRSVAQAVRPTLKGPPRSNRIAEAKCKLVTEPPQTDDVPS